MNTIAYSERLAYALRQLQTYNKIIHYGVPEEAINLLEIEQGFNSPFNSPEEVRAKKMLVAASTEAIMSNTAIPASRREKMARKNAEELCLAFDAAKLDFTPMSKPEYEERIKRNAIARRAAKLERIKRALKRKGAKLAIGATLTAIGAAIGVTVSVPAGAVYGIYTLIPDNWKKQAKKVAVETIDKAAKTIDRIADRVSQTKVGRKIAQTCRRIQETTIVRTISEGLAKVGHKTAEVAERVAQTVSRGAKRAWDFVKSFI